LGKYIASPNHDIVVQSSEPLPMKKPHRFKGIWKRRSKHQKAVIIALLLIAAFIFIIPKPLTLIIFNESGTDNYINVTVHINGVQVVKTEIYSNGHRSPAGNKEFIVPVWGPVEHIEITETDDRVSADTTIVAIIGGYETISYGNDPPQFYFSYSISHPMFL
jgi:hypothetical protein